MRLVTYQREGQARTGAQLDEQVVDLNRAYRAALQHTGDDDELVVADARVPIDMTGLLRGGDTSLRAAQQAVAFVRSQLEGNGKILKQQGVVYATDDISLLPPVVRPSKVICLGLNYRDHAAEAGMAVPDYPVLFHKVAGSLTGHKQPIVVPRISSKIDYEGELAIIIGRRGKYIAEDEAYAYIAGYTIANDVSARDLQFRTSQWTTADMIFRVPFIVSYISEIITLEPGDVILTGTPPGIGNTRSPQVFMKPGDTIEVEIGHLGKLTNPVVAET